jgi:hypothetical protein
MMVFIYNSLIIINYIKKGCSSLYYAANNKHPNIVRELILNGVILDVKSIENAKEMGHEDLYNYLK